MEELRTYPYQMPSPPCTKAHHHSLPKIPHQPLTKALHQLSRKLKISHDRAMIRIRKGELPGLKDLQTGISQDIIDPQGGGNIHVGSADSKSFADKSILPAIPDGEIGIGIGNVIEIPDHPVADRLPAIS